MRPCEQHWLNRARLRLYCATLMFLLVTFEFCIARFNWRLHGEPSGLDFATFWAASRLTLAGTPLKAYSWEAIARTVLQSSPLAHHPGPWFYPPNFLLLVKPLGLLPFPAAYAVFALVTATVFILLLRKAVPLSGAWLPILAFPGLWLNLAQGQNACLTASLALGALLLLEKRPVLAGICIGMLSIKPHLAVLFPVVLACAGMWTAFFAAAVSAALLTAASVAVFGTAIVPVFLHGLSAANGLVAAGALPWPQMASPFASLRMLHVGITPAYVAHACAAIIATLAVIWVWRKSRELAVRAMALVAGTFMLSPYIYNYDAAWLAIPIALFTVQASRRGWLRWEREILCVAWLYPALGDIAGYSLHAGIGPLLFASLMLVAVRRTRLQAGTAPAKGPAWLDEVRFAWARCS
jgi:alpha-1,2-mannosyltransferase